MPRITALAVRVAVVLFAARALPAAACESCGSPGGNLPAPTASCQLQPGETTEACPTHAWVVDLTAGTDYTFTLCDGTCPGADADFDARLRLLDPSCGVVADVDDWCGPRAEIRFTAAVSGPHVVEVTGSEDRDVGPYVLGYFGSCRAGDCGSPNAVLNRPTTECQSVSGSADCGDVQTYSVTLVQGQAYTFTLCDATCPGAGAAFDSALELVDPSGATVASGDSECGDDAEIVHETDPTTGGGEYCVRVIRQGGSGEFTLGYRVACQPPSDLALTPLVVGLGSPDCTEAATFSVVSAGTGPFTVDWSIAPPLGGTATPASGSEVAGGEGASFTSVLAGPGTYAVTVTMTNDCGSETRTVPVLVEDRRAPDLILSASVAECGTGLLGSQPKRASRTAAATPVPDRADQSGPVRLGPAPLELRDVAAHREAGLAKAEAAFGGDLRRVREPGLPELPRSDALGCGTPCTAGVLEASHPFYDVFLSCSDGSFTARTGDQHPVTVDSGFKQNVIYAGAGGSPGTSDIAFRIHDLDLTYQDPFGGEACPFDPPDTEAEPNSVGLEAEWQVEAAPGVVLTLREEIVAFGTTEADSGIRLSLGIANDRGSDRGVNTGVRWQIDYQNAGDDGPLFATVACDPLELLATLDVEHELPADEIADFYRIQNNTGTPIFANYTSTTSIAGFPGTGVPDRLVYGYWPTMVSSAWDRVTTEGDTGVDWDSAVHYTYGHLPADGIPVAPGESYLRSVVIFTAGEGVDCGGFVPGDGGDADLRLCAGECAELAALAADGCGDADVVLVSTSPGAPPCEGNPCTVEFPDAGTYVYAWEAVDEAGNATAATTTVQVVAGEECTGCRPSIVGPPADRVTCAGQTVELDGSGLTLPDCTGTTRYSWSDLSGIVGEDPVLRIAPDVTTTYVLDVTCDDGSGCSYQETVTVTVTAPPPPPAPVARDVADCNLGLEVSWEPVAFPSGRGVYNVYRSEVGCDDALARPPVALGLPGPTWMDGDTVAGRSYVYVVQAEDGVGNSPCVPRGPDHGGAVASGCSSPVVDQAEVQLPDGVYATLRARHDGDRVTFTWADARSPLPGEHFHLLKAAGDPASTFARVNPEQDLAREHSEADVTAPLQFFDLRMANACEVQSLDEYPPTGSR